MYKTKKYLNLNLYSYLVAATESPRCDHTNFAKVRDQIQSIENSLDTNY